MLDAHGSELNLYQWNVPPSKVRSPSWGQFTSNSWLMWEYKGLAFVSQNWATLKISPNFTMSHGNFWGLCCNLLCSTFPLAQCCFPFSLQYFPQILSIQIFLLESVSREPDLGQLRTRICLSKPTLKWYLRAGLSSEQLTVRTLSLLVGGVLLTTGMK